MSYTNQIVERIAQIQILVEVPGEPRPNIILSEPYQPSFTSSMNCPFFVNEISGGASGIPISAGQQYIEEDILMFLCIKRREAQTDLKLSIKETVAWRDAVFAAFSQRVKLSDPSDDSTPGQSHVGLPFVVDGEIINWKVVEYEYGDSTYLALQFIFHVNEMYVTTIAP